MKVYSAKRDSQQLRSRTSEVLNREIAEHRSDILVERPSFRARVSFGILLSGSRLVPDIQVSI